MPLETQLAGGPGAIHSAAHAARQSPPPEDTAYDRYVRTEWHLFASDPDRSIASRHAVGGVPITRVLDIGCGAGQELRPFLLDAGRLGIGIDVSRDTGRVGRELFASVQHESRVSFVRAAAEQLPLQNASVDVVICRLTLPYTDNARTLSEVARVLRPTGMLLLKFHHVRYYVRELADALAALHVKSAVHACRVLLSGTVYHLTGSQPQTWITGRETYQTMWLLRRELRRHGLEVHRTFGDSVPSAPSLVITHRATWPERRSTS